ncbi:hypothetical protein ACA910_011399 [Epithemia clementina (nom. ined.)]
MITTTTTTTKPIFARRRLLGVHSSSSSSQPFCTAAATTNSCVSIETILTAKRPTTAATREAALKKVQQATPHNHNFSRFVARQQEVGRTLSRRKPQQSNRFYSGSTLSLSGDNQESKGNPPHNNPNDENCDEKSPYQQQKEEEITREAAADLFAQYSVVRNGMNEPTLDLINVQSLLQGVGANPAMYQDLDQLEKMLQVADTNGDGLISLEEFWHHAPFFLDGNPARIILVVGGPGSGKGVLCRRLQRECHAVHLSSGELLRAEVARKSPLGLQVQEIMAQGKLVSSAIIVALMKQEMRNHPGKRVLLDGFPRSLENAYDLTTLCGKPELALHLVCQDTVLLERILGRGASSGGRLDDNFQTALQRLRTFHKYHPQTMEWLREQQVPVVNLDCSGSADSVWQQLQAIGRLMRPAVKVTSTTPSV